jgi:hypothetical protein
MPYGKTITDEAAKNVSTDRSWIVLMGEKPVISQ